MRQLLTIGLLIFFGANCVHGGKLADAVQIMQTRDGQNGSKVLHYKGGSVMQDVLTADDVRDLPILVYSVTGKTRGGKSFLLNLMYKYLDAEGKPNWIEGPVPNIFDFKDGVDSKTKGLWLCTRIFRRTNKNGTPVGIMLLDNQGLFDGEVTGGESVAMSGVSTILSHVQMFNMKEKITTNDLEQIMLHFVPRKVDNKNSDHSTHGTSLTFVVRDFTGGKIFGFGLQNGRKYIEAEQTRGTQEYQSMWADQRSVFNQINCVLFPHPGLAVMSEEFTEAPALQVLQPNFVSEVDAYFKQLFSPDNLTPRPGGLTARGVHDTLSQLDGKPADNSLSYYNMYVERTNKIILQEALDQFAHKLETSGDIYKTKDYMKDTLNKTKFVGHSAGEFTAKLTLSLEGKVNSKVVKHLINTYRSQTSGLGILGKHGVAWPAVVSGLTLLVGSPTEVGHQTETIVKEISVDYYGKLVQEESNKFDTFCETTSSSGFYHKMISLRDTNNMNTFLESMIKPCKDFEIATVPRPVLEDVRRGYLGRLGVSVQATILRKMYKVKEHLVQHYRNNVHRLNAERENAAVWPTLNNEINALKYETEMERVENTNDIVKKIAEIYYNLFREDMYGVISGEVAGTPDGALCPRYNVYKDVNILRPWINSRFPEYYGFRDRGLTYIWNNEKEVLQNYVKLDIFQNLQNRRNNCAPKPYKPSGWVRFRDSIFG